MDPTTMVDAAPSGVPATKKRSRPKKLAKDLTTEERKTETEKRAGRWLAARARLAQAKLDKEHWEENERFLTA